MGTEERKEYSSLFSYGLICPFLSRREGFSNDCLRQYCMMWQDNECLFVAMYKSLKRIHRIPMEMSWGE